MATVRRTEQYAADLAETAVPGGAGHGPGQGEGPKSHSSQRAKTGQTGTSGDIGGHTGDVPTPHLTASAVALTPAATPLAPVAPAPVAALADAHAAVIAEAKRRWLQACADGSSSAQVQRLYEEYRQLVITQVAAAVQGGSVPAS